MQGLILKDLAVVPWWGRPLCWWAWDGACGWRWCRWRSMGRCGGEVPVLPPRQATANHALFEELDREIKSGPEVTEACSGCHTEAARQIMRTTHRTWRDHGRDGDGGTRRIGKAAGGARDGIDIRRGSCRIRGEKGG